MNILKISFLFLLTFPYCSQDDWREQMEVENQKVVQQIEEDHKIISDNLRKDGDWSLSSKSKEQAVKSFLKEITETKQSYDHYVSWDEKMNVIFPNILGQGTMLDTTLLSEYRKILEARESVAISDIRKLIKNGNFRILSIEWEKPRTYGKLRGHKPKSIKIWQNDQTFVIDQIKMVYETKSGYKVGVLGP